MESFIYRLHRSMNSDVHWPFSLLIFVTSLVSTISTFLFYSILPVLNFHIFSTGNFLIPSSLGYYILITKIR